MKNQLYYVYNLIKKEYVEDIAGNPTKYRKVEAERMRDHLNKPYTIHQWTLKKAY